MVWVCCSECIHHVGVGDVYCVHSPGCTIQMLVEMSENCLHVGLVKIPSNNEKALSVNILQLTDSLVENT